MSLYSSSLQPAMDILTCITDHLNPLGYGVLESNVTRNPHPKIDLVVELLDGSPVTLTTCQAVHRLTTNFLAHDARAHLYADAILSISSPGLERPLITYRDYQRAMGHEIIITIHTDEAHEEYRGILKHINDTCLSLQCSPGGLLEISWDNLKNGRYVI